MYIPGPKVIDLPASGEDFKWFLPYMGMAAILVMLPDRLVYILTNLS